MRSVKELDFNEKKLSVMKEVAHSIVLSPQLKACGISLYHLDKTARDENKKILGEPLQSTDYLIIQSIEADQVFFVKGIPDNLNELNNSTYACFGLTTEQGVLNFMNDYLDRDGKLKL